jgi:hypothetical protein
VGREGGVGPADAASGTPAEVGGAVAALCSAGAGRLTGQPIAVAGGALLLSPEVPLELQRG